MTTTYIAAYLLLFFLAGFLFLLLNLVIGKLVRPDNPHAEKLEIYECGEPTIGSSFVQFDLRFYTVALLFLIFDVEVAFFFPWAVVFGKATNLQNPGLDQAQVTAVYGELGVPPAAAPASEVAAQTAATMAQISFVDILVFFAVLMVGFFYVWKRGDLDWVRAVSHARSQPKIRTPIDVLEQEPAMTH